MLSNYNAMTERKIKIRGFLIIFINYHMVASYFVYTSYVFALSHDLRIKWDLMLVPYT